MALLSVWISTCWFRKEGGELLDHCVKLQRIYVEGQESWPLAPYHL